MDEELHRLIVSFEARTDQLDKLVLQSQKRFSDALDKMERRQAEFQTRISRGMEGVGKVFERTLGAIGVGLSFEGLKSFVEKITETAMNAKKQAAAIGVNAEVFQAWSIMAKKADVDQTQFNTTLERIIGNIGKAQIEGSKLGTILGQILHMSPRQALAGSAEDVIYRVFDALHAVNSPVQRAGLLRELGGGQGGGSVALGQFFSQGSAAARTQVSQLKTNHEVMDNSTLEKIYNLDKAWTDFQAVFNAGGAAALVGVVDGFKTITGEISNQKFQEGLRNFGNILGEIVGHLARNPAEIAGLGGAAAGSLFGPWGAAAGGILGFLGVKSAENQSLPALQQQLKTTRATAGFANNKPLQERARHLEQQISALSIPNVESTPAKQITGVVDLYGAGVKADALQKATQAIRDRMAAMRTSTGDFADYTAAQEAARVKTELLSAVEADARTRNVNVAAAVKQHAAEIEKLAESYGALAASKAWDKSLTEMDNHIAKMGEEAKAAGGTARALAELEARSDLMAKFHATFGDSAVPNSAQQGEINARVGAAGQSAASDAFAHAVTGAQRQVDALQGQNSMVGLYSGALAAAQMRMELLNAATEAGVPIDDKMLSVISGLSTKYGSLAQAGEDSARIWANQVSITDELRGGLENMGAAALEGGNAMKSAASQFVASLAEMILKLYVLQPLLESVFGKQGTAGGGSAGSFLSSIFGATSDPLAPVIPTPAVSLGTSGDFWSTLGSAIGFANGGVMTPSGPRQLRRYAGGGVSRDAAIFGEAGPEAAVPLPDGRSIPVNLRLPRLPSPGDLRRSAGGVSVTYAPNIQVSGADDNSVVQIGALLEAHRQQLPVIIHQQVNDMASRRAGPWNG